MSHGLSNEYATFRKKVFYFKLCLGWLFSFGLWDLFLWAVVAGFGDLTSELQTKFFVALVASFAVYLVIFAPFYHWWLKRYVATYQWELDDEGVVVKEGVFTWVESRVPYSRIQNVGIVQTFWEKVFGWSRVLIQTAGGTVGSPVVQAEGRILGLKNPIEVQGAILARAKQYLVTRVTGMDEVVDADARRPSEAGVAQPVDWAEIRQLLAKIVNLLEEIRDGRGNLKKDERPPRV
ncbi:MAG: hypothetical protein Kow0069_05780 [Promethearchaeota archaeon]